MAIRNNTDIVRGDELWLFVGTSATQVPTCFATQHSLNRSMNTTSVSSKDHGNTSYVIPGEGSWTCSTEALMSIASGDGNSATAFDDMMEAFTQGNLVYVKFGKLSNYLTKGIVDEVGGAEWAIGNPYWSGKGYITSLQASGGHGDSATYSIEITGVGPLTRTPAAGATGGYTGIFAPTGALGQ